MLEVQGNYDALASNSGMDIPSSGRGLREEELIKQRLSGAHEKGYFGYSVSCYGFGFALAPNLL